VLPYDELSQANLTSSRGKKIFKKFPDAEEPQTDDTSGETHKRLTRSSIKPRLLFPPKRADEDMNQADEEADTDIESGAEMEMDVADQEQPETPLEVDVAPGTPKAPKFAPASPPTTARATRSGNKVAEEPTPIKSARTSKRSPFDYWRHTKSGSASSQKRHGDELGVPAQTKRARA
jgi:hypothetical protein